MYEAFGSRNPYKKPDPTEYQLGRLNPERFISRELKESVANASTVTFEVGPGAFPMAAVHVDHYVDDDELYVGWNPCPGVPKMKDIVNAKTVEMSPEDFERFDRNIKPLNIPATRIEFIDEVFPDESVDQLVFSNMLGGQHKEFTGVDPDLTKLSSTALDYLMRRAQESFLKENGRVVIIETNRPAILYSQYGNEPVGRALALDYGFELDGSDSKSLSRDGPAEFLKHLEDYGYVGPINIKSESYITVARKPLARAA